MELEEKEKLIAQIRKHISENLDLRKDFSDEEIKDIITNVVFERSRDYYLSVGEKKEIADAILIP